MRLTTEQIEVIRRSVTELAGQDAQVSLFGSRTDDAARGGDIDLFVEVPHPVENATWLSSSIAGRISLRLGGQKVDVLLSAPNLEQFPIHDIARSEGVRL